MVAGTLRTVALPDVAYRVIGWFSTTRFDRLLHPLLYRLARGRGPLGHALGSEMILVTMVGRRSGQQRTVALFGFRRDGGWLVVGSRGGSRRLPAWYRNLAADPAAVVQSGGRSVPIRARELGGEQYEAAFEQAAAAYPGYRVYRRRSPIHIPILLLEPVEPVEPVERPA
jgi:deazaflavin-dependent oxidoreductase (nitroreductase family)